MLYIEENNIEYLNDLDDLDTSGIIPTKDFGYDFNALREYCKKKGIKLSEVTVEEAEKFSTY